MGRDGRRWNPRRTVPPAWESGSWVAVDPDLSPSLFSFFCYIKKCEKNRKRKFFIFIFLSSWWLVVLFSYILLPARRKVKRVWAGELSERMNKTCVLGIVGRVRVCVCGPPIRWFVRSFLVQFRSFRGDVIVGKFAWTCAFFTAIVFISSAYPAECTSLRVNEFCWLSDKKTKKDFLSFSSVENTPAHPTVQSFFSTFGQTVFANLSHHKASPGFCCCCCTLLCTISYCDINNHFWRYLFTPAHHFPLDLPSIEGDQQLLGNLWHALGYTSYTQEGACETFWRSSFSRLHRMHTTSIQDRIGHTHKFFDHRLLCAQNTSIFSFVCHHLGSYICSRGPRAVKKKKKKEWEDRKVKCFSGISYFFDKQRLSLSLPLELQVCRVSLSGLGAARFCSPSVSVGSLTRWLVVHSVPTLVTLVRSTTI